jgi:hypothetical protein
MSTFFTTAGNRARPMNRNDLLLLDVSVFEKDVSLRETLMEGRC